MPRPESERADDQPESGDGLAPGTHREESRRREDAGRDGRDVSDAGPFEPEKPKPPDPRRRRWRMIAIIGGIVVVLLAVGAWLFLPWRNTVSTDDAFIAADAVQVSPRVAGRVVEVAVDDNRLVAQNDLLIRLDPADFQARTAQARAALVYAQAQVTAAQARAEQAVAETAAAQAEYERAAADLSRYEQLPAGVVSESQRDLALATQRSAQARLTAAQRTVAAGQADVEQAKAQVEQSQAALNVTALQESYTTVRAPVAGRVTNRAVDPGDYVREGQTVIALVPVDVYVLANFKETQLTNMRPGQPVSIKIDAYPKVRFDGHVDSIQAGSGAAFALLPPENATGNYVKVVQRVPVKIVFDKVPDPRQFVLGPGMSVVPKVRVK